MLNKVKMSLYQQFDVINYDLDKPAIIYSNIQHEKMSLGGGTLVPMKYFLLENGGIVIAAIPELKDFSLDFFQKYKHDLFSSETFAYLYEQLPEKIKKLKMKLFLGNDEKEKYRLKYGLEDKNLVKTKQILNSTIKLNPNINYVNNTIAYGKTLNRDRLHFGTVIDNEIVSIVGTNVEFFKFPATDPIEIGVETLLDFRKLGYATSNVRAMCEFLLKRGYSVTYNCHNKNIGSQKTALNCGFTQIAREKHLFCINDD